MYHSNTLLDITEELENAYNDTSFYNSGLIYNFRKDYQIGDSSMSLGNAKLFFKLNQTSEGYVITGSVGSKYNYLSVPETIGIAQTPVIGIDKASFMNVKIKSLSLGSNLKYIDDDSFNGSGIKYLNFNRKTVYLDEAEDYIKNNYDYGSTEIGYRAFINNNLEKVFYTDVIQRKSPRFI